MAFTRCLNSRQNWSGISSATSSRQPSMPKRIQCSATPSRYSRTSGLSVLSFGQRRQIPPRAIAELLERSQAQPPFLFQLGGADEDSVCRLLEGPQLAATLEELFIEVEPIAVRRPLAELHDMVERPEAATRVVEHAIEDDPDAPARGTRRSPRGGRRCRPVPGRPPCSRTCGSDGSTRTGTRG